VEYSPAADGGGSGVQSGVGGVLLRLVYDTEALEPDGPEIINIITITHRDEISWS
jgi:hypothetical protein